MTSVDPNNVLRVGLDVGSTTVKFVVVNSFDDVLFKKYAKHYSDIKAAVTSMINDARDVLAVWNRFYCECLLCECECECCCE